MDYLKNHKEFADIFLEEPDISDFFKRDVDGQIKGTSYFFKLCYNDIENLVLICHACNIGKGADDPLEWFRQQETYFGEAFVKAVEAKNGLHKGVILPKIYASDPSRAEIINIGRDDILLYEGEAQGLGEFAMQWFFKEHKMEYDTHKEFYTTNYAEFKGRLARIRELIVEDKMDEAREACSALRKATISSDGSLVGVLKGIEGHPDSGSGSDSSGGAKRRRQISGDAAGVAYDVNHQINKIRTYLMGLEYESNDVGKLCDKCADLHIQKNISKEAWEDIFEKLKEYMEELDHIGMKPESTEIEDKITKLYEEKAHETERMGEQLAIVASGVSGLERRVTEAERREREAVQRAAESAAEVVRLRAEMVAAREGDRAVVSAGSKRLAGQGVERDGDEDRVRLEGGGKR